MNKALRTSGLVKIRRIAREDNSLFKYRKKLVGLKVEIHTLYHLPRDGPWFIMTGVLPRDIWLNGMRFKKGGRLWFRRVNIKLLSHN